MGSAKLLPVLALIVAEGAAEPRAESHAYAAPLEQRGQQAHAAEPSNGLFPAWLPPGGLYGHQKWVPGSNGVDVFLPRSTVIRAPVAGLVVHPAEVVQPLPPPVPAVALRGDNGLSFFLGLVRPLFPRGPRCSRASRSRWSTTRPSTRSGAPARGPPAGSTSISTSRDRARSPGSAATSRPRPGSSSPAIRGLS
jgi:hypothetical protein